MQTVFKFSINSLKGDWNIIRIIIDTLSSATQKTKPRIIDGNKQNEYSLIRILGGKGSFTKITPHSELNGCSLFYEEQVKYLDIALKASQTYLYRLTDTHLFIDFPNDRFINTNTSPHLVKSTTEKTPRHSNLPLKPFCYFDLAPLSDQSKTITNRHVCGKDKYDITLYNQITEDLLITLNEAFYYYHENDFSKLTNQAQELYLHYQNELSNLVNHKNGVHDCFVNQAVVKGPNKHYTTYTIFHKPQTT